MKRISIALLGLFLATLACGPVAATPVSGTSPAARVTPSSDSGNKPLTIAVEYAIFGLADEYAAAGVTYAKLQDAFAIWGNIETEPGQYHWEPLDALVLEYQQAGFTGLQMDLTALSPWAASKPPQLGNQGDTFPREEYLDDYARYVTAVVERYDQDGVEDMPGLLYAIHDYGIEREFTGFWPGSAEEYVRLLRIAYPAIKSADPDSRVLLVALLMADVFDGSPDPAEINRRLAQTPSYMRKSVPEIQAILKACDAYDMVDFHSLGDYTEIPATSAWIREQLQANGCGEKPIWIGDAFPMSGLIGYGGFVPPTPFHPVTLATRDAVMTVLQSAADPSASDHATALTWLNAEISRGLTRKIIVSAGEGISGINLGNMEDWKTGIAAADKASVPMLGASMFMGMTDTTMTQQKPGGDLPYNGQGWSRARKAGNPRPVYAALELVVEKIGNFSSVEKLNLEAGIWAYRFVTPSGPVWVMWYDDGQLYLPGQTSPSLDIELPFEFGSASLTRIPTESTSFNLQAQILDAVNGSLNLPLDSTPVFIQPAP